MTHYVGLDVSQKLAAICFVDDTGRADWAGIEKTYVKVRGQWAYLYRAVENHGNTIGF
jgi:transposase-like protein